MQQFAANWIDLATEAFLTRKDRDRAHRTEIMKRVAALKAKANCISFPTDLDRLGSEVGIVAVRDVPLGFRGRLVRKPGGFGIEIDSGLSALERRFIVAHEIAHLLIERDTLNLATHRVERSNKKHSFMEELCDFGAREILLPIYSLRSELRHKKPSLELVSAVAKEAQCPLHVPAVQICDTPSIWKCRFIWWTPHNGRMLATRVEPTEGGTVNAELIELADENNSLVCAAMKTDEVVNGIETLRYSGSDVQDYESQAIRSDTTSVLTMLIISR